MTVLLADASAAVRAYTGQQFDRSTTTERFRIRRNRVLLTQMPVVSVASVVDLNSNTILFTFDGIDRVQVGTNVPDSFTFEPWVQPITTVDVTYTHGYAEGSLPADITAVVCGMVTRALGVDPLNAATVQEGVGPYSRTIGSVGAAGAVGLLPAERETLDRYRRVGGFVQVGP